MIVPGVDSDEVGSVPPAGLFEHGDLAGELPGERLFCLPYALTQLAQNKIRRVFDLRNGFPLHAPFYIGLSCRCASTPSSNFAPSPPSAPWL